MTTSIPLADLETGGNSASWKGKPFGFTYSGRVTNIEKRQQLDLTDGSPKFFPSGDPMPVWLISIEQENGETVVLWASKGAYKPAEGTGESMMGAIGTAVRAIGAEGLSVGDDLAVSYTGEGEAKRGQNPPRLFTAQVRPAPPVSIPADLFSS